jgi:hypothetical protein
MDDRPEEVAAWLKQRAPLLDDGIMKSGLSGGFDDYRVDYGQQRISLILTRMDLPTLGGRHWHLSISFWDGAVRESLAKWWLRCLFGIGADHNAQLVESSRTGAIQFLVKE